MKHGTPSLYRLGRKVEAFDLNWIVLHVQRPGTAASRDPS